MTVFQSTRPRGARPVSRYALRWLTFENFNPRAREGRDQLQHCYGLGERKISIHAPARGATRQSRMDLKATHNFNPRAREGRDFIVTASDKREFVDFNPRAREGRDQLSLYVY